MRGKERSLGHSAPRPCSDWKTGKKCMNNVDPENIVIIDVDNESISNVINIDSPECLPQKLHGSNLGRYDKKSSLENIIFIDDDESSGSYSDISILSNDGGDSEASTSTISFPNLNRHPDSFDASDGDFQFVLNSISPVKLSKCKRTYSGKTLTGNCYGLSTEAESDASDNDFTDCEFMVDSCGKLRELWEKASLKRKNGSRYSKGQSSMKNVPCTSSLHADTFQSTTRRQSCEKEGSPFVTNGDDKKRSTSQNTSVSSDDLELNAMLETQAPCTGEGLHHREGSFMEDPLCNYSKKETQRGLGHDCSDINDKDKHIPCCASVALNDEQGGDKNVNYGKTFPHDKGKNALDRGASFCKGCLGEAKGKCDIFAFRQKGESFQKTPLCGCKSKFPSESKHGNSKCKVWDSSVFRECSFTNIRPCDEMQVNHTSATPKDTFEATPEETFLNNPSVRNKGISENKDLHEVEEPVPVKSCDDLASFQDSIIGDREKLKETDEYKLAVEKEWESRKQQLRIQAEEAQELRRLLKRKKAEALRLLDMERRQKQRVEEIRETQKKDKENMDLKELIRMEVQKELSQVEIACHDMASLLRGLGIHVGSGLQPLSHEVHAAYKQALLRFHPDRASKSNIRDQVEAEEKFKLVSRMKEKFLLVSR